MEYTLSQLGALLGAQLVGDPDYPITGVDTLEEATSQDASFLANPRYLEAMKKSKAGVVFVEEKTPLIEGKNFLITDNPSLSFQKLAEIFFPTKKTSGFSGIHPSAVIHPSVRLAPNVTIGPHVVIDRDTIIGENTVIGPNTSIGFCVEIGRDCFLHPHCTIREHCKLKDRVILQPGAVIGSCGFGYTPDKTGRFIKLEQLGIVIIEDDVEIGANTTIDRARFKATIIRKGSKIDNLVQIAHNVEIGENNVIAAQTGIAGSAKTGNSVMLGGQVGVLGHVTIKDKAQIATRGGVSKSLGEGKYRGSPAIPIQEYNKQKVLVRNLKKLFQKVDCLEKKLQ